MTVVALAAERGTTDRVRPVLALIGRGAEVVSFRQHLTRSDGQPIGAVVAASVAVLGDVREALGPDVAIAAWVNDTSEAAVAYEHGVEVALSSDPDLADHGVIVVPEAGIEVGRFAAVAPLVRARWRQVLGLPDHLAVGVDDTAGSADAEATLALAGAVVVRGAWLPTALALGAPVVTSEAMAKRFGLRPGLDVEVARSAGAADRRAAEVAADEAWAARLSRRGRAFAEHHLDLGAPAAMVRRRLGLDVDAGPTDPALRLDAALDALATPVGSRLRGRAMDAVSAFDRAVSRFDGASANS